MRGETVGVLDHGCQVLKADLYDKSEHLYCNVAKQGLCTLNAILGRYAVMQFMNLGMVLNSLKLSITLTKLPL